MSSAAHRICFLVAASLLLGIWITVPSYPHVTAESSTSRTSNEGATNGQSSAGSLPTIEVSPSRLATLNDTISSGGTTSSTSISNIFVIALTFHGASWDLGDGLYHSTAGVTNFTASSDPDFSTAASLLTDGVDGFIQLDTWWSGGGGSGIGSSESRWLHGNPDLIGYRVDFIRLVIQDLHIYASTGGTQTFENDSWEIWGERVFIAYYPPTDPNGTYLIDRRYTDVNVSLEEPGTAVLNWNGTNRTMFGGGTNWRLNVSGLANGVYAYRAWAKNGTGVVFGSELRYITVGKGIWSLSHIAYGFLPSIAFDVNGYPHLCLFGSGQAPLSGLVYGHMDATGWHFESVEAAFGESCSIVLDLQGNPHISYIGGPYSNGTTYVKHAFFNGTGWIREYLASVYDSLTSIAISPVDDQPMIAFADVTGGGLKLASRSGGVWNTQTVDSTFNGVRFSLAIDSNGNPRIAYADYDPFVLKYVGWNSPKWSSSIVDCCADNPSLALDSKGLPHVAYLTDSGIKYASLSGTTWSNATVDVKSFAAVSLALDSRDRPHIAYEMEPAGDLRYAAQNGTWAIQVVSHDAADTGLAMALRPSGDAGILFMTDLSNGDLVYATNMKDTAPPSTTVRFEGTLGAAGWYRSAVQVTLVATDALAVLNTTYRVDRGAWRGYSGPFLVTGEGGHTIEYFSTDYAENVEALQTASVRIDTVPPTVQVETTGTAGQPGWYLSPLTVALVAADATSGVDYMAYRIDAGPWQNYTVPFEITGEGPHFLFFSAADLAGNTAATEIFNPLIDTVAPSSSISISGTTGAAGWYTSAAFMNLSATDSLSGVAFVSYRVDGGPWANFAETVELNDGVHLIEYRATDRAGNVEATHTTTVRVDTIAPTISTLDPVGTVTSARVAVSWAGRDATSGISRYELRVDGGAAVDLALATNTTLMLGDGAHTIEVHAVDAAGNSASRSTTFIVDTNVWSLSGPNGVVFLYSIVAAIATVGLGLLWRWRRKRPLPP